MLDHRSHGRDLDLPVESCDSDNDGAAMTHRPTGPKRRLPRPLRAIRGEYCADLAWARIAAADQRKTMALSICMTAGRWIHRLERWLHPPAFCRLACTNRGQIAVRPEPYPSDGASARLYLRLLNLSHRDSANHPQAMTPGAPPQISHLIGQHRYRIPKGPAAGVDFERAYRPAFGRARGRRGDTCRRPYRLPARPTTWRDEYKLCHPPRLCAPWRTEDNCAHEKPTFPPTRASNRSPANIS